MKRKESSIYSAFLRQAVFQSNEIDNKGKLFIEEFQLIKAEGIIEFFKIIILKALIKNPGIRVSWGEVREWHGLIYTTKYKTDS